MISLQKSKLEVSIKKSSAKKILIIEDEILLQEAYAHILRLKGYSVAVASDGIVGLEQLKNTKPDLVLLDILMPRMDGLEFLQNAHAKERFPNTKIIAFSNLSKTGKIDKMLKLGACEHILKSGVSPSQLLDLVARTLKT